MQRTLPISLPQSLSAFLTFITPISDGEKVKHLQTLAEVLGIVVSHVTRLLKNVLERRNELQIELRSCVIEPPFLLEVFC